MQQQIRVKTPPPTPAPLDFAPVELKKAKPTVDILAMLENMTDDEKARHEALLEEMTDEERAELEEAMSESEEGEEEEQSEAEDQEQAREQRKRQQRYICWCGVPSCMYAFQYGGAITSEKGQKDRFGQDLNPDD